MIKDPNLRRFLTDLKERSNLILAQTHVGADVKELVKDLLGLGDTLSELLEQTSGQNADVRLIRKRMEQVRTDSKATEEKFAAAKNAVFQLATEIELIGTEAKNIKMRIGDLNGPNGVSLGRIESSVQNIVKAVIQLSNL